MNSDPMTEERFIPFKNIAINDYHCEHCAIPLGEACLKSVETHNLYCSARCLADHECGRDKRDQVSATSNQSPLREARDNWYRANLSKMPSVTARKDMRELLGQAFTAGANWVEQSKLDAAISTAKEREKIRVEAIRSAEICNEYVARIKALESELETARHDIAKAEKQREGYVRQITELTSFTK